MRIRVLGAGIIGLACAEELLRRGHHVQVVDRDPGRGASRAAAGMLAPAAEAWHGEEDLLRLGQQSLALWPAYAARLGVPLHRGGTLLVGIDHGDAQHVARQVALLEDHGSPVERLDRRGARSAEPLLGPRVGAAIRLAEASLDPRAVVAALAGSVPVQAEPSGDVDVTVLATGARLPDPFAGLVRPVHGEILRLRAAGSRQLPGHTIRGWVRGRAVYVVPRATGEIVVGATSEEHALPPIVTAGGVARLLTAALELVPSLDRAELREALARSRPGSPDNLPLVGPTGRPGVLLAAGHFRHGVLLAPLTARLLADHLDTGFVEPAVDPRRLISEGRPA